MSKKHTALEHRPEVDTSFSLVNHFGLPVTNASYHGRYVLVFFGFTRCKVVCPRTLTRICQSLDIIGAKSDLIQPLYITMDPQRDTPEVMRAFLEEDFRHFIGLSGSLEQVDAAKRNFRVYAQRVERDQAEENYDLKHTSLIYVLDADGEMISHFTSALEAEDIASRLQKILFAHTSADL
jgi:protein SCO1/2